MRNINEITEIIANLNDDLFDRLNKADEDRYDMDRRIARNGLKRLHYNLKKINITIEEWDYWCWL